MGRLDSLVQEKCKNDMSFAQMQLKYLTNQLSKDKFDNVSRKILDDNFENYFPNLIPKYHHRAGVLDNIDDISSELESEVSTAIDAKNFDIPDDDNADIEQELMSPRGTKRSRSRGSMLTDFYERISETKIPRTDEYRQGVRNSPTTIIDPLD